MGIKREFNTKKMVTLNEIFESPKIKEIGNKEIVQTKDFSNLQKNNLLLKHINNDKPANVIPVLYMFPPLVHK